MTANAEQRQFWSDIAGPKWAASQTFLDELMQSVLDIVIDRAGLSPGHHVLDIGCGTGASCLAAADRVGDTGHVLGVDISGTLLDLARARSEDRGSIRFIEADAASHAFALSDHDRLISRFGVMFFADPVAAFANMTRALKPGGQVTFATWGAIPKNPYFTEASAAARDVLGEMPRPDPDAPGPFAFRYPNRVLAILGASGLQAAEADVIALNLTPKGALDDLVTHLGTVGAAEGAMRQAEADVDQRARVSERLRTRFAGFDGPDGLRIPAEINLFTATAP